MHIPSLPSLLFLEYVIKDTLPCLAGLYNVRISFVLLPPEAPACLLFRTRLPASSTASPHGRSCTSLLETLTWQERYQTPSAVSDNPGIPAQDFLPRGEP